MTVLFLAALLTSFTGFWINDIMSLNINFLIYEMEGLD